MRFTTSGAAAALLLASMAPAGAQMSPMAPAPMAMGMTDWSGFYAGLNVGGAQASDKFRNPFNGTSTRNFDFGGPLGGGTAGYNWQVNPNWVLGVETDVDASGISGSTGCPNGTYICGESNSWMATIRGRAGYAPSGSNMLWFVTGGGAFGDINRSVNGPRGAHPNPGDQTGWTVGGGVEDMFAPQWSVKVEYRYAELGFRCCSAP